MKGEETEGKKFRYTDENERYKSVNKFYFIGMNALYAMFVIYLLMRTNFGDLNKVFAYVNLGIVFVFEIINNDTTIKNTISVITTVKFDKLSNIPNRLCTNDNRLLPNTKTTKVITMDNKNIIVFMMEDIFK